MNLYSYIDKYGCYTFDEVPFNEIDNAVFSALSYVNFEGIVSPNRFSPITISMAANMYFQKYTGKEKNILSIREAVKMLRYMKDTRRYSNLKLYNYIYKESNEEQFSALTIEINSKLVYVSYEGTDHLVSGWKEDFMISYMFPVSSQRRAIDYINKHFVFRRKKIILGGHSKGGNLAVVAAMYSNFLVKDKIISIYNNDGPGLLKEQIDSKYYKSIEDKLIHIIPMYSVVGLLLYHSNTYKVVRTSRKGLLSHDLFTWVVRNNSFMESKLDTFYKVFADNLISWLEKYDNIEREKFVLSLFDIFERANVKSFIDVMENKKLIFNIITESKGLDVESRGILKEFILLLLKCFKDDKREEFMSLFGRK